MEVKGVSVRYPRKGGGPALSPAAVEEIDFEVRAGEFVAIIGPSGCGKSTLLKAVAGLVPLSAGSIEYRDGEACRLGFVFQTDALLPWKTASANIEVALQLSGQYDKALAKRRAHELLEEVGLGASAESYPSQLSGGMRKRVAIARALAYDPAAFLMDEPFSALDAQTRIQVGNFFLRVLEQAGQAVLFVTHDIDEAVALADRVLVMSRGPGRITASISIDLPKPRDYYETRFNPGFHELQMALWNELNLSHGGAG